MIRFENVTREFISENGRILALDHVNLEIKQGQFVVVRGPSGCGKTTLLMTMAGMLTPTSGSVKIGPDDLYALGNRQRTRIRAHSFGFVFQMFHLIPYLNVIDNVTLAGPAAGNRADRAAAGHILDSLGLSDRIYHRPSQLSSGEKQRVAMARALFNSPPIMIADEPTGNLDESNAAVVYEHLGEYHRQGGTVVLVTHDSNLGVQADIEVRIRSGRIEM